MHIESGMGLGTVMGTGTDIDMSMNTDIGRDSCRRSSWSSVQDTGSGMDFGGSGIRVPTTSSKLQDRINNTVLAEVRQWVSDIILTVDNMNWTSFQLMGLAFTRYIM